MSLMTPEDKALAVSEKRFIAELLKNRHRPTLGDLLPGCIVLGGPRRNIWRSVIRASGSNVNYIWWFPVRESDFTSIPEEFLTGKFLKDESGLFLQGRADCALLTFYNWSYALVKPKTGRFSLGDKVRFAKDAEIDPSFKQANAGFVAEFLADNDNDTYVVRGIELLADWKTFEISIYCNLSTESKPDNVIHLVDELLHLVETEGSKE